MFGRLKEFRFLYRAWRYRWKVERAEIAFVRQSLKPGDFCIDIGGHKGAFTYWMQRVVGPAGQVHTFEPQAELAGYLRRMCDVFAMRKVNVINAAVSSTAGKRLLLRDTEHPSPSASLEQTAEGGRFRDEVSTIRLDDYFAERAQPIRLIKVDVEGHELEVFRGAEGILREDRPTLLFECEQRHQPNRSINLVFELLESLGYQGQYFQAGVLRQFAQFGDEQKEHGQPGYVYNFVFEPGESQRTRRSNRAA